jgi:hypothetical protein
VRCRAYGAHIIAAMGKLEKPGVACVTTLKRILEREEPDFAR